MYCRDAGRLHSALDPLAGLPERTPRPASEQSYSPETVGLRFFEITRGGTAPRSDSSASEAALPIKDYLAGESQAQKQGTLIEAKLVAYTSDLSKFLDGKIDNAHCFYLSGSVSYSRGNSATETHTVQPGSYLRMFGSDSDGESKLMTYYIESCCEEGIARRILSGRKIMTGNVAQLWREASSIYVSLRGDGIEDAGEIGVLRVDPADFFLDQIASHEALGTRDAERQAWAIMAFAKFFVGELIALYVPARTLMMLLLKNIVGRTHV